MSTKNINENEKSSMSQRKQMKAYLERGKKFTALDALYLFGSTQPAARIFELKEMGMDIISTRIVRNGKHIVEYSLNTKTNK